MSKTFTQCEQEINELIAQRTDADQQIARLQNLLNNLAQREEKITECRKVIIEFCIEANELFPEIAPVEVKQTRRRRTVSEENLERVDDVPAAA